MIKKNITLCGYVVLSLTLLSLSGFVFNDYAISAEQTGPKISTQKLVKTLKKSISIEKMNLFGCVDKKSVRPRVTINVADVIQFIGATNIAVDLSLCIDRGPYAGIPGMSRLQKHHNILLPIGQSTNFNFDTVVLLERVKGYPYTWGVYVYRAGTNSLLKKRHVKCTYTGNPLTDSPSPIGPRRF